MIPQNKVRRIRCPYCGKVRDAIEFDHCTEKGNFQLTEEKFGDLRDLIPDYKILFKYKYTLFQVPICTDCLIIHQEASFKATVIGLCVFLPIVFYLLTQYHFSSNFILLGGLVGVVCLIIRWIVKVFIIHKQGIRYRAHNESCIPLEDDSVSQKLLNIGKYKTDTWADRLEKEHAELQKEKEEWDKHHEIKTIETEDGKTISSVRYISDYELFEREREKEKCNVDFSKKNKLENGAHIDYDDEDFEGHFV